MNRKLLVTLLHKNIEELNMITDGFMDMNEYPAAIILLARRKTEDIQTIIEQLSQLAQQQKPEEIATEANIIETSEQKQDDTLIEITTTLTPEKPVENISAPEEHKEDLEIKDEPEIPHTEESSIEINMETVEEISTEPLAAEPEVINTPAIPESSKTFMEQEEEKHKVTIAEKITSGSLSRNETMSRPDNSLSASIANKKVDDIKQAISIGDRFRFQRELFKGNGEDMNKTMNYLNQLATLEEAISFLQSKYAWTDENEASSDFYQIIKRKFL